MADSDVKVKFGGDFSGLSKGASAAAEQAGMAMANSFGDAANKATKMFLGAFAVTTIVSNIYSGIREAGQYFMDLQNTMKKTGASSSDLQTLGKAGKESGVGIEQIGMALVKTNKFLNEASQGSAANLNILRALGLATDENSAKQVKAIDVVYSLSDAIKKSGDATQYTETIMKIFGKSGADLIPVLQMGSEHMKELAENAKIFTDEEIRAGVAAEKAARAAGRAWDELMRELAAGLGEFAIKEEFSNALDKSLEKQGLERYGLEGITTEQQQQLTNEFLRTGKKMGMKNDEILDYANKMFAEGGSYYAALTSPVSGVMGPQAAEKIYNDIVNEIAERNENATDEVSANFADTLEKNNSKAPQVIASSLQAIGGGDIGSVYQATYDTQAQILDVNQQQAESLKSIDNKTPNLSATSNEPVDLAK